jgi:DNA-binding CsgD family transcriptional regulator
VPRSLDPPALPLTERENEIFVRIGWGLGPSEIAEELGIHVKTIETHRESVKRKLGLDSAAALRDAAFAWREGDPLPTRHARPMEEDSA